MRIKAIIGMLVMLFIFSLGGCEKAPSQSTKSSNIDEADIRAEKYVSMKEAKEQCETLSKASVYDFQFSAQYNIPDIEQPAVYKLEPYQLKKQQLSGIQNMIGKIWDDYEKIHWENSKVRIAEREEDENYKGITKEDESTGAFYSCDTSGFFCGSTLRDGLRNMNDCIREYDFTGVDGTKAGLEDSYSLFDGDITIREAVCYVEGKLNQFLPEFESGKIKYQVQIVYVMQDKETGKCDLNMVIEKKCENIAVTTVSDFEIREGIGYKWRHCGAHMTVVMRKKNEINYCNSDGELLCLNQTERLEKIISPYWAVKKMNQEVAHTGGVSYSRWGLVYIITQKNEHYESGEQGVYGGVNSNTYLKPYWMFAAASGGSFEDAMTNNYYEDVVLVDASDGELYYYDTTGIY